MERQKPQGLGFGAGHQQVQLAPELPQGSLRALAVEAGQQRDG
jgi:hypothetical protein